MPEDNPLIQALREALSHSPQNVVLRKHLAGLLFQQGDYADAEREYRTILDITPQDQSVEIELARAFLAQEKWMAALVILEPLIRQADASASVFMLSAKAYLEVESYTRASEAYHQAIQRDSALADSTFEEKLKAHLTPSEPAKEPDDEPIKVRIEEWVPQSNLPVERSSISFQDVGGMESVKEDIRMKIIHPLNHPDIYKAYGKSVGGGILMYGPPGCGKTYLARATAGEVNAYFLSIGIHDVLNLYLGRSEQNLHQLFETARRYRPCVVFIDEIDALGAKRSDMRESVGRHVINQLLVELDGIGASNDGMLVLAATNAPWHMDSALHRSGRFDQMVFVPPPDLAARIAILQVMLRDKPARGLNYEQIARHTTGFSGADLKGTVDRAIENKLRESLRRGVPAPLETSDLVQAAKSIRPSTKEWFATARSYAIYANQSGLYDDVLTYLDRNDDSGPLSKLAFWRDS